MKHTTFKSHPLSRLSISENKRYFIKEDGTPFLWLADTVWTMPQRMKWDDVEYYMQTRKNQGFTVLQIVALDPERDEDIRNPAGEKALINNDLSSPNENYFSYLDWILDRAEAYGFYVLLLPVWGQMVVGENWQGGKFPKTVNEGNAYQYGKWIGSRYRTRTNILWCLGGDRHSVHNGTDYKNVWRRLAEGLAKGVLDKDLKYNQNREEWKDLLITYHSSYDVHSGECSTMSFWTDEEAWIQFIMLQSGHGLTVKNYELIKKEYDREHPMPVWDGEPAYEAMPNSWPVKPDSYHGSWMVRRRAYFSLFAGAFGFTYGHSSMWCTISPREVNPVTPYTWYEALTQEGAYHIKNLRDFLESIDLTKFVPSQEILLFPRDTDASDESRHIQACKDMENKRICVYFPQHITAELELSDFPPELFLRWYDPRNGNALAAEKIKITGSRLTVTPPSNGSEEDWILLLGKEEASISLVSKEYGTETKAEEVKKVFEW